MRPYVGVGLLVVFLGSSGGSADDDPTPRKLRQAAALTDKAEKHLAAGSLGKARQLYDKALSVSPGFPDAQLGLGHLAMRDRRFEDALEAFHSAEDGFLEMSHALLTFERETRDRVRQRIGQLERRVQYLQQQAERRPNRETQLQLSITENELRRLEALPPPDDAATSKVPPEIHFFIGNALMNLAREDEAVTAWETCAREHPGFPLVYNNLAVAYWKAGRKDEARAALAKAEHLGLQVNPEFKAALTSP
jgi:tetratricopeptide (TPR) repeat protein